VINKAEWLFPHEPAINGIMGCKLAVRDATTLLTDDISGSSVWTIIRLSCAVWTGNAKPSTEAHMNARRSWASSPTACTKCHPSPLAISVSEEEEDTGRRCRSVCISPLVETSQNSMLRYFHMLSQCSFTFDHKAVLWILGPYWPSATHRPIRIHILRASCR